MNLNIKDGLVSLIIPTMSRSKLTSIKTLIKKRYLLRDALLDIKKNVSIPHEVIVICNSLEDKKLLKLIYDQSLVNKFILNSVNVGVPRSWNMGAEMAQGEYLCFVNDDVEIKKGAIEKLVESMTDLQVGEVGPQGSMWYRKESGKLVNEIIPSEVDAISGWLFLTRRSVFDEVGGFDINYTPALCEEIDFSFAVRNAGYRCVVIPGINAEHHHISGASSTSKPLKAFDIETYREELTEKNRSYFEKKWEKFWND